MSIGTFIIGGICGKPARRQSIPPPAPLTAPRLPDADLPPSSTGIPPLVES